jgi:hypothetical protein
VAIFIKKLIYDFFANFLFKKYLGQYISFKKKDFFGVIFSIFSI